MISSISWIPKGVSKPVLLVDDPSQEEDLEENIPLQSSESTNKDEDVVDLKSLPVNNVVRDNIIQALKDLHMERYDDEDETSDLYYPHNNMDPYLKDQNDSDSEELENMTIYPTDSVIVCARTRVKKVEGSDNEDSFGVVEVWIREDREKNMFLHHVIEISALPLCTAWLDCPLQGGERGNFLAVGSMEPNIEIFNVDVITRDGKGKPCMVLGSTEDVKKKGKLKSTKYKNDGHSDSVLGLAWNKEYRNIIASASADKKVKIWDVVSGKCEITMGHHTKEVQAVAWNHHSPWVLLTGSFDGTVFLKDGRIPSHDGCKWKLNAKVESLAWDPHSEHSFVVSLENGTVRLIDVRTAKSDSTELRATSTIEAHNNKACTSVSYNLSAPNLLATGSEDETVTVKALPLFVYSAGAVKLWDLSHNQPSCVASYSPEVGSVYSVSFSEDNPFLLAIGGSKGNLRVWDTQSYSGISQKYGNYMK
ncbi:hypothetical protein V8G54_032154 [Vigna mungo]|uniref:Transducin/WD40 repeat-like superfamily protein n=1 Tax=Vigna mungo TaxID=3915 RepID=A0AAQ3MLG0_VIGMU